MTAMQWVAAFSVGGSLLAVSVPAFVRNLHASRLAEPVEGLSRIAQRATALAAGRSVETAYPESAPLTPAEVPRGVRVVDAEGTWDHPTWRRLNFGFSAAHSYSFSFESTLPTPDATAKGPGGQPRAEARRASPEASFRARAHGDLDGDGVLSTFEVTGWSAAGAAPQVGPLVVHREVE